MKRTAADEAADFVRRAVAGEKPVARVPKRAAKGFLGELIRLGVRIADVVLDEIKDEQLKEDVRAVLTAATASALLGAAVGGYIAGPPGAAIGAAGGAVLGAAAALILITVRIRSDEGTSGTELVVKAA